MSATVNVKPGPLVMNLELVDPGRKLVANVKYIEKDAIVYMANNLTSYVFYNDMHL